MDRNLALEAVRVVEAAALACARWMGRGDEKAADQAAVDAMRRALNGIDIDGTVVIGEGERDEAPMLYIGEKVGTGKGPPVDIALDPLEGTTICATGRPNAIACVAMATQGCFLHAPDTYMDKIAVGPMAAGAIDIRKPPTWNLQETARKLEVEVRDLTAIILDRPRHTELIREVREAGARIRLIGDGDVSAAIATALPESGIDILFGTGGAPEGVLAAAALRAVGGEIQGVLKPRNEVEIRRAKEMGIADINKVFTTEELAKGDVMFAATGVTGGDFLRGVRFSRGSAQTYSLVMRSSSGTMRYLHTYHHLRAGGPYAHLQTDPVRELFGGKH